MSDIRGNESTFEEATIQRLRALGYEYVYGPSWSATRAGGAARRAPRHLRAAVPAALRRATSPPPSSASPARSARRRSTATRRSTPVCSHEASSWYVRPTDARTVSRPRRRPHPPHRLGPPRAEPIPGRQPAPDRRPTTASPDIVIYVNGLPLVVFELKNPWDDSANVDDALNQIQHYTRALPAALRVQRALRRLGRHHHAPRHVDRRHGVVRPVEVDRRRLQSSPARPAA